VSIRTEADVFLAVNMANDLEALVVGFLEVWKTYANGVHDVTVPCGPMVLSFRPLRKNQDGRVIIVVALTYTHTVRWQEPQYYDVDSDYFSESWGADNISGYSPRSKDEQRNIVIDIPVELILCSKNDMIAKVKAIAVKYREDQVEAERQRQLAVLHKQIKDLESKQK